jgi:hypothetical protein
VPLQLHVQLAFLQAEQLIDDAIGRSSQSAAAPLWVAGVVRAECSPLHVMPGHRTSPHRFADEHEDADICTRVQQVLPQLWYSRYYLSCSSR